MSKYCAELMPLLLGYLSLSLNNAKIGHVRKAFYALENFLENLGEAKKKTTERNVASFSRCHCLFLCPFFFFSIHRTGEDIESYLSTLMETMLSTLNNNENLKIKELTVSAIGGIGEMLSVSGLRTGMND